MQHKRRDKVIEFFDTFGPELHGKPEWSQWFGQFFVASKDWEGNAAGDSYICTLYSITIRQKSCSRSGIRNVLFETVGR